MLLKNSFSLKFIAILIKVKIEDAKSRATTTFGDAATKISSARSGCFYNFNWIGKRLSGLLSYKSRCNSHMSQPTSCWPVRHSRVYFFLFTLVFVHLK